MKIVMLVRVANRSESWFFLRFTKACHLISYILPTIIYLSSMLCIFLLNNKALKLALFCE